MIGLQYLTRRTGQRASRKVDTRNKVRMLTLRTASTRMEKASVKLKNEAVLI